MKNNNNHMNNDSESLKRSHSKSSNFKLTMLCLLSSLALTVSISSLALMNHFYKNILLIVSIASAVVFVITVTWFSSFKR